MTAAQAAPQRAWRLRYWSIFAGQALSRVGSALTQFVLLWWITDITGSVTALGMAGFAALLPQALLATLLGLIAPIGLAIATPLANGSGCGCCLSSLACSPGSRCSRAFCRRPFAMPMRSSGPAACTNSARLNGRRPISNRNRRRLSESA